MVNYKPILGGCLIYLALSLSTISLFGQEPPPNPEPQKPKPAGTTYPIPTVDPGIQQDDVKGAGGLQPDNTPLTGIQSATLGSPEIIHSYWIPEIGRAHV
jgi:hypothetical protein